MADYSSFISDFADRKKNWGGVVRGFMSQVGTDMAGKAPADHSHGAGGEVVGIGLSTDRPVVADGYIFSETDTDQVNILNADGTVRSTLARQDLVDSAIATAKADAIDQVSDGLLTTGVEYVSNTEYKVTVGNVEVNGIVYSITSDIVKTGGFESWNAGRFNYVYVIVPSSGTIITSDSIAFSNIAPLYDSAKGGWYHPTYSDNRCIGVIYEDSTPAIKAFDVGGDWWNFLVPVTDYTTTSPPTTPSIVQLTLPDLLVRLRVLMGGMAYGSGEYSYVLVLNGDDGRTVASPDEIAFGWFIQGNTSTKRQFGEVAVTTNTGRQIKTYTSFDVAPQVDLITKAFELPPGLRRTN